MSGWTIGISAGLSTLGAAATSYAGNQQMRKQDSITAAGLMKQRANQAAANADVSQSIDKNATQNHANINKNQVAEQAQYAAALARAAPARDSALSSQPGGSSRYAASVNAARSGVADYGNTLATNTAAVDAPQLTQEQTALGLGDTATKLGLIRDTSANEAALTAQQVKGVGENPWLLAGGAALQGAAAGYGSYAGSKAKVDRNGIPITSTNDYGALRH